MLFPLRESLEKFILETLVLEKMITKGLVKKYSGGGGPEQRGGGSWGFERCARGGSCNFQLPLGGGSCYFIA